MKRLILSLIIVIAFVNISYVYFLSWNYCYFIKIRYAEDLKIQTEAEGFEG